MRLTRRRAPTRPSDHLLAFGGIAAVLLVAARFVPFHLFPPICGLRNATGLPCPTCGMTRAFVRVTHGDLQGALQVSPLGAVLCGVAGLLVFWLVLRLSVLKRGFALHLTKREKRIGAIAGGVLLAVNWAYLLATGAATG